MKRGLMVISGIFSLLMIASVLAFQSQITVKTGIPNQEIIFRAADSDTGKTFAGGEFKQRSDSNGEVVFSYNLEPILIKAGFMAWNGNNYLPFLNEKEAIFIPNIILDEFVNIDLNKPEPSWIAYDNKPNETDKTIVINNESLSDVENETKGNNITDLEALFENNPESDKGLQGVSITGNVIGKGKEIMQSIKTYYIFGGFLVLILGFIFVKKKVQKNGASNQFKVTKLSEMRNNTEEIRGEEDRLTEAEKKLNEAKLELDEIKNRKNKLKEVQERMERDKEELRRLKSEEGKDDDYLGLGRP